MILGSGQPWLVPLSKKLPEVEEEARKEALRYIRQDQSIVGVRLIGIVHSKNFDMLELRKEIQAQKEAAEKEHRRQKFFELKKEFEP
jgi:hypothetical protein